MASRGWTRARRVTAAVAAVALAGSLAACTASVGGYLAVAEDEDTGDVVVHVELCEPTSALELRVTTVTGGTSGTVWSAAGKAQGRRVTVHVGAPPAGWTTTVDGPLPESRPLHVSGWTNLDDDDPDAPDLRLTGPRFAPDELPRTQVMFEVAGEVRRGSVSDFVTAAREQCAK